MPFNLIIGMGNAGCQIIKAASESGKLTDCKFYAIDSALTSIDMDSINNDVTIIPMQVDQKSGSGRSRERGATMFEFHDKEGSFNELYKDAASAKSPIIIITSSAGGTGSGSTPLMCKRLMAIDKNIQVIPIIICPAMKDPDAFHLNTTDLMLELNDADVSTYSVFRNEYGKANYDEINDEVVSMLEIILGKRYDVTDKDSIDESDLDVILATPGRFIAVYCEASTPSQLKRHLTEKVLNGHQPAWGKEDSMNSTLITAFALASPFASTDFEEVFSEINARIEHSYDEYRSICNKDGACRASIIVAGLPRAELKNIDLDFQSAAGIAEGITSKSKRPAFMQKKGGVRSVPTSKPVENKVPPEKNNDSNGKLTALSQFNVEKL